MFCLAIGYALISTGHAKAASRIPSGTPIHLVLLKEVGSATSKPGQIVPLVVSKDVIVDGKVVISEDTMAFARVKQCRAEGALSASVFDRPARLSLTLDYLTDAEGHLLELGPGPNKTGEFQITREMTAVPKKAPRDLEMSWADAGDQSAMSKVHSLFADNATSLSVKEAQVLIGHNIGIPAIQNAARIGLFGQVLGFVKDIRAGRTIETLLSLTPATRPAMIVIRSVRQLGLFSADVGRYISGRFKGRNIHCPAGVELTVYAATGKD